jgi:hypothetical protein
MTHRATRQPLAAVVGIALSASWVPALGLFDDPHRCLELNNRTLRRLAPESRRIDLVAPSFFAGTFGVNGFRSDRCGLRSRGAVADGIPSPILWGLLSFITNSSAPFVIGHPEVPLRWAAGG